MGGNVTLEDFSLRILITGGAGFIGSTLVRKLLKDTDHSILNVDKLTYAGNLISLHDCLPNPRHYFEQVDICDVHSMRAIFERFRPTAIIHLAAESHVDRSIDGPSAFINTNIWGTYRLLEVALNYQRKSNQNLRFLHVSTDEVFGDLGNQGKFNEETPYRPNSPYAATKASSDHLVRAWYHTYHLPILITHCSNNYGPYQYPEKLIPLAIEKALTGKPIPIYGKGENVRDWLYVEDHAEALYVVLKSGTVGSVYNIGARCERTNLEVITSVCRYLDHSIPRSPYRPHEQLISFVEDRPGHDYRYAIDPTKIETQLGWRPKTDFQKGLFQTIQWYIENQKWCAGVMETKYTGERLGVAPMDLVR